MISGAFTEKMAALDVQMAILTPIVEEAKAELLKDLPEIANNGEVIAVGDHARAMIQGFLALHEAMEALASDFRKSFGH